MGVRTAPKITGCSITVSPCVRSLKERRLLAPQDLRVQYRRAARHGQFCVAVRDETPHPSARPLPIFASVRALHVDVSQDRGGLREQGKTLEREFRAI